MSLDHEPELIRSFDDTAILVRKMGSDRLDDREREMGSDRLDDREREKGDGLPVLICNGVGANLSIWRKTLVDLARERPLIAWDMRGLHGSGYPASDRIDPGAHAEDAIAALEHFGFDRFVIAAWSNGSRVALELAHRYPERVAAQAIVCGAYGHPLGRVLRLEPISLLPTIAGIAKHFASFLERPLRTFVARPEFAGLVRQSGLIGATADTPSLVDLLREMADCELGMLLRIYEAVAGDSAGDIIREIEVPTLLVAGERDQVTPLAMLKEMERAIPDCRLEVYERATHVLPIEYPARLSDDLRKFFAQY
jgi:pimeloyl-ACP methyl ester carboxylesterase